MAGKKRDTKKNPQKLLTNPFAALLIEEETDESQDILVNEVNKETVVKTIVETEENLNHEEIQTVQPILKSNDEIETKQVLPSTSSDLSVKGQIKLVNKHVSDENFIVKESINLENIGLIKLNTPWTLWFHHDPNDWNLSGYKKIATFKTVDEYLRIMSHIHMVTSIKTINLYLFREGIEPTWEDHANSNGGFWSVKVSMDTGIGLWKKMCDKAVCETILKTSGDKDINGTVNGISITSKLMNTIVKIWVSDRKISSNQWIDNEILSNITSKIIYQVISPER